MKKIFLLITLALLAISTASALEPIKVAIFKTGAAANVQVILNDYTGGNATAIYTGPTTLLTPNGSGVIIINIANNVGTDWTDITAAQVNSYYVLDVLVGGTLYAQYRLDQQILNQAQGGILDTDGNLTPSETGTGSVGSDDNRWSDVYVEESTMHIGPPNGELNNTELALSYNTGTNTAHIKVDANDAILATSTGVTIPGTLTQTAGQVTFGGNVDANAGIDITGAGTLTRAGAAGFVATVDGGSGLLLASYPAVQGDANTENGVSGTSNSGTGIYGVSNSNYGVHGLSLSTGVAGVFGRNDANGGYGLQGYSFGNATAIHGNSNTGISGHLVNTNAANASRTLLVDNNGTNDALEINATGTGLAADINGDVDIAGNTTLSSLAGGGTQNIQVDNAGKIITGGGGGGCNIYGDGSAGDVTISANTDWSTTPPTNGNYMFNSLTINAGITLTLASGTVIQSKTTVVNNGTITVKTGVLGEAWSQNADRGNSDMLGYTLSSIKAYPSSEVYRRVFKFGPKGGSGGNIGGTSGTETFGGNGGGTLSIFASTGITNAGIIEAKGESPAQYLPASTKPGCGGGGGGFVVLATNSTITNSGIINVSGGNGNNPGAATSDLAGSGGGGGLIHYISTNAIAVAGTATIAGGLKGIDTQLNVSYEGVGGASVGNPGIPIAPNWQSANGSAGAVLRTQVADACSFINN